MIRLLLSCLLGLCTVPLLAQERILSYDSDLQINTDGSLDVTERIRVRAEGDNIRRGIYRDFPTRYEDRHGNRIVVDFEVVGLQRDGQPEPYFVERLNNGVRVNFGNDDLLPVPAEFTYTMRYRTTRQLGFFAGHDELYWNAIGHGWMFGIDGGTVTLRLPEPVPADQLLAECYTGVQGARTQACAAEVTGPGTARWTLSAPLAPQEGLTTILAFPKGLVPEPTRAQQLQWLLRDNRAPLIALVGLVVLLVFAFWRWHVVGRDPKPGTVVVTYEPPDDLSPAVLRYIEKHHADALAFSADVLALAVAGHLSIHRDKTRTKEDWRLERVSSDGASLPADRAALLRDLFEGGEVLKLDGKHPLYMLKVMAAHRKRIKAAIDARFRNGVYRYNGGSLLGITLITALFSIATFVFSGGAGLLYALPLLAAMVVAFFVFLFLLPAITPAGRTMRDRIEGFRRYLTVADKQDLARLKGPGHEEPMLDAARFEFLLPYAVALDVEAAWTAKFTAAVGASAAAAATASVAWFHANGNRGLGALGDTAGIGKALGSGLTGQIASSASPPGSASGSSFGGGGGGFSGGGGGGGGGGGR
ncbi:MAG: DUF2207 domain-containing protein [Luteimonas sp.]